MRKFKTKCKTIGCKEQLEISILEIKDRLDTEELSPKEIQELTKKKSILERQLLELNNK